MGSQDGKMRLKDGPWGPVFLLVLVLGCGVGGAWFLTTYVFHHESGGAHGEVLTEGLPDVKPPSDVSIGYKARYRGEAVSVRGEGEDFLVAGRKRHVTREPCSRCHGEGSTASVEDGSTHAGISRHHPQTQKGECSVCHAPDEGKTLVMLDGSPVPLDHSYELCGQCHFRQRRDWAGGAHGKRLSGWAARRVIENCTGCHDPHDPGFETRLPATNPRFPQGPSRP